jgi:hypothetical protein
MLRAHRWAAVIVAALAGPVQAQPLGGQPQPQPTPPLAQPEPVEPVATEPDRPDPVPSQEPPTWDPPASEPAEEVEETGLEAWFRVDADRIGTQIWAGITSPLGPVALAMNGIMIGTVGEVDVGVAIAVGDLRFTPVVGLAVDFAAENLKGITAPRLITTFDSAPIYFESWLQLTFESPFEETSPDLFYTRNFLLWRLGSWIALGPQVELTYQLNHDTGVISLPIGGQVEVRSGADNRLSFFLGYDTEELPNSDGAAGRVTFIHDW